jgi:hypothetical protein
MELQYVLGNMSVSQCVLQWGRDVGYQSRIMVKLGKRFTTKIGSRGSKFALEE